MLELKRYKRGIFCCMMFLGGFLREQRWVVEGRKEKLLHRFPGPCPCWLLYFFGSLTDHGMSGEGIRVQHRIADQRSLCWVLLSTPLKQTRYPSGYWMLVGDAAHCCLPRAPRRHGNSTGTPQKCVLCHQQGLQLADLHARRFSPRVPVQISKVLSIAPDES